MKYTPNEIEAKWQKFWADNQIFKAENTSNKPKYYVLDMFPYPSGAGLHVGHPLGYIASDIVARYKRHKGFNVLHPMGYDSFGLPAEQYAIQTGQHPEKTTQENIARYRNQLDKIGFSFDWNREIRTSDYNYYKWTQWIFIELFSSWYNTDRQCAEPITTLISHFKEQGNANINACCDENTPLFSAEQWNQFSSEKQQQILLYYRLAFLAETEVNWCPALGTVLANDEVINGVSERGGYPVIRKKMTQWSMRISAYAERLLQGLDTIDWTESLKESQRNWIGKSIGAQVYFPVKGYPEKQIPVFTTRPDTIFGVTYLTLAPEHEWAELLSTSDQIQEVKCYIEKSSKRSERERMSDTKNITGVFTGAYAIHPLTGAEIPIWIGDYVLSGYGTGAVMAVPAGDERDFAFAQHFSNTKGMYKMINIFNHDISEKPFTDKGGFVLKNSSFLDGLTYEQATKKIISVLEEKGLGKAKVNYRLRDAVFSRQRYWGEPFPVYYKNGLPQMIDKKHLPIILPNVEKYLPTSDGQPPLGNATHWGWDTKSNTVVSNDLIDGESVFPLELNTMPGWAGSSWYWLRYMDAQNQEEFVGRSALDYWKNVDLYLGGSEHATGHLLYARFWNKFLKDRGLVPVEEPFQKLINQGMILGNSAFIYRLKGENTLISSGLIEGKDVTPLHVDISLINEVTNELDIDAFLKHTMYQEFANAEFVLEQGKYIVFREVEKMSKSKYNVVNPDDICQQYGADTLRLYEMFLGPLEQAKPWNTAGITGVSGFLKKMWRLFFDDQGWRVTNEEPTKEALKTLHKTIKKITEDIEHFSFNTAVSQFMICVNELTQQKCSSRSVLEPLTVLLSPFAPHISEELWQHLGHQGSISKVPFPEFNQSYLEESEKEYPVSFNGKVRFKALFSVKATASEIEEAILQDERTQQQLQGKSPKKVIVVLGRIINIVL